MYNTNINGENNKEHFQIILEKIRHERKNRFVVVMLTVFGDESYDEKKQRVYAVSGLSGTQQEWDDIEKKWIQRTGGVPFHASECEAGRGAYKDNSQEENKKLLIDMTKIIANSKVMGFVSVLDLESKERFFPDTLRNFAYYFCFSDVVRYFADMGGLYFPQEKKVEFIFDRNMETEAAAYPLYEYMSLSAEYKKEYESLDSLTFAKSDSKIGIQAADLVAREAMKHYENIILGLYKYPVRKEMNMLSATNRFRFSYYAEKFFKAYFNDFDDLQNKSGIHYDNYVQWLKDYKLHDNNSNRHRYLIYCHKTERTSV